MLNSSELPECQHEQNRRPEGSAMLAWMPQVADNACQGGRSTARRRRAALS